MKVEKDLRKKNIAKYGDKDDDVIARAYRDNFEHGNVWCLTNAMKYCRRFLSKSEKGNNLIDLIKAHDYLTRALEENEKVNINTKEVDE
jgi:hypothetical protein